MSLLDLSLLYTLAGLACAVAIYRAELAAGGRGGDRLRALGAAALAIPLWPLWAPVALGRRQEAPRASAGAYGHAHGHAHGHGHGHGHAHGHGHPDRAPAPGAAPSPVAATAARIEAALAECADACAGTPVEALLPADATARIAAEVARAATRHAELSALLGREGFDLGEAERRLQGLERDGASARAVATARLHLDNVRRLVALRDRDARALDELADLVQALRAQLHLARYAGASVAGLPGATSGGALEGTSGIVAEVWARVEGLSAVLDPQDALEAEPLAAAAPAR